MYYIFFNYIVIVNSYFDSYRNILKISHIHDVDGKVFNNILIFSQQFVHIALYLFVYVIWSIFAFHFMVE